MSEQQAGRGEGRRVIRSDEDMTAAEIEADTYLELDDACLAGLVRGMAADYADSLESEDEWRNIAYASGVAHLLALALKANAAKLTKELKGVTRDGEDVGDWRVTLERTRAPEGEARTAPSPEQPARTDDGRG